MPKTMFGLTVSRQTWMYTPMVAGRLSPENRSDRQMDAPLRTEGTGWDIGWAAVFLASDESRWVTGVVLPLDAGLTATTQSTYQRRTHRG